jgi:hypothetical protein
MWTTAEPSEPVTLPIKMCLSPSARLAIYDAEDGEVTLLFAGFNSQPRVPGVFGAYLMVSALTVRLRAFRTLCAPSFVTAVLQQCNSR